MVFSEAGFCSFERREQKGGDDERRMEVEWKVKFFFFLSLPLFNLDLDLDYLLYAPAHALALPNITIITAIIVTNHSLLSHFCIFHGKKKKQVSRVLSLSKFFHSLLSLSKIFHSLLSLPHSLSPLKNNNSKNKK